jgi:hypothetical protein
MLARSLKSEWAILALLAMGGLLLAVVLGRPVTRMASRGATVLRILEKHALRPAVSHAESSAARLFDALQHDASEVEDSSVCAARWEGPAPREVTVIRLGEEGERSIRIERCPRGS